MRKKCHTEVNCAENVTRYDSDALHKIKAYQ